MFSLISKFILNCKNKFSETVAIIIMLGCITLIVILAFFAIKMPSRVLAVMFSTTATIFLMFPVVTSFNAIVEKRARNELKRKYSEELELQKKEIELAEKEKEIEKQKLINLRQKVNIETLKNEVTLLKNNQLQINNCKEIAELSMLESNLKITTVRNKQLDDVKENSRGFWMFSKKYSEYDDALVIVEHDIVAKFGFDINEIKIINSKEVPNAILVSNVKPKFIGTAKNKAHKILTEVRHHELDIRKIEKEKVDASRFEYWKDYPAEYKKCSILFERETEAVRYADEVIDEFNERLSQGLETEFLYKPLEERCKNYVRFILLSLNKQIIFVDDEKPEALTIDEYFKTQILTKEKEIKEIQNANNERIIKKVNLEIEG